MRTYVGFCEVRIKSQKDDVWTWFARDESLLVMHPAAALLVTVFGPIATLVVGLAIIPSRIVVPLRRVVALTQKA